MMNNPDKIDRVKIPDASPKISPDPFAIMMELGVPQDAHLVSLIRPMARDLLKQLDPKDPAERMLVTQMIATFTRSIFLSRHANIQKNHQWFTTYSAECDRAMETFRRQIKTLAELRRPRRNSFTTIRRASINTQQIVVSSVPTATVGPKFSKEAVDARLEQKTRPALPPE